MQKLYTENDIRKAFWDARLEVHTEHGNGWQFETSHEWIQKHKGQDGILKKTLFARFRKHLPTLKRLYIDPEHQPKTVACKLFKVLTK